MTRMARHRAQTGQRVRRNNFQPLLSLLSGTLTAADGGHAGPPFPALHVVLLTLQPGKIWAFCKYGHLDAGKRATCAWVGCDFRGAVKAHTRCTDWRVRVRGQVDVKRCRASTVELRYSAYILLRLQCGFCGRAALN